MKKSLLLVMLCMPVALMAQSNGVKVSNLAVRNGSPSTVTFDVSWKDTGMPALWVDSAWVFVDYNNNGVMDRLPVTSATATAGTVTKISGNDNGVWVAGNARTNSSFSATVQLVTTVTEIGGACVYGSNYPPVGKYTSTTSILFTGTPPYTVHLKHNSSGATITQKTESSPYVLPSDYTVQSFVDKTGAPGKLSCIWMAGNIDFSVPAIITKGQPTTFTVNAGPSNIPVSDDTYAWSASGFVPDTHAGATFTTTAPSIAGMYPVVLTARSEGYCDLVTEKEVEVIDCIASNIYNLNVSASGFCADEAGVTFALSGTQLGRTYLLYKDDTDIKSSLVGTGAPDTFSVISEPGDYTVKTMAQAPYCTATMNGSFSIASNPLPAKPAIAQPADVCLNIENIVFTATNYTGSLEWVSDGGGAVNGNTVTFTSTTAGVKTVIARSAQTYVNAPTCYSSTTTQWATVVICCTVPGSTVDFTAFDPCPSASIGATWYLQDTREADNNQEYKVRKMADGRIWMVQDMKFGDLCGTTFAGSTDNQTGHVSSIGTYYGDCRNNTQANAGYLYDWAGAINKNNADYGSSTDVGCSGTAGNDCQGICPAGWHIPTGNTNGEFDVAHAAFQTAYSCTGSACWNASSQWEGVFGGYCSTSGGFGYQGSRGFYHASTYASADESYKLRIRSTTASFLPGTYSYSKRYGYSVRCIMNR